jgi:hypothetical protein
MIGISLAGHGKDSRLIQLPFLDEIPDKEKGNENYTPSYFFEPCRDFLGGFDLDPFSNAIANKSIQAKTYWTKDDNALIQDWTPFKKKWVNPPYWKLAKDGCIDKILAYREIGETLLLVNSSTSAKWFHKCMSACDAYLHPFKRIPFYNPYRELEEAQGKRKKSGNEYDQTLFYFGDRPLEFAEALSNLGNAVQPIRKICLPTSTHSGGLEPLALPVERLEKSPQLPTVTSAKTRKKSISLTSLKSRSISTSEAITPQKELTSLLVDFPAQEHQKQEERKDLITPNLPCGLSISGASKKDGPDSSLSKIPQDYLIVEWEQSCKAYPKAGTMRSGRLSPLPSLEVPKREKEFLSLPTLTTGLGSGRNAGATRSEKWLKDKKLLLNTQVLNPQMMALLFSFPMNWTECLLESPKESEGETMLELCLVEQSISTAPPSPSNESSICIEFSANNIDASSSARLNFLLEQRDRLISSGASPQGVWINCGKVPHRDFKQAAWKSDKPRKEWKDKKSKYIGEFGKEEHLSAITQHKAGQKLRKVEREIKKLQVKS